MERPVDELVQGRVQRSYLERDGWWAQLVLDEFDFLRRLGFELTGSPTAGIHFHQKGHTVGFHGPKRDVVLEYDPESSTATAAVVEHPGPKFISLDDLIVRLVPRAQTPARSLVDQAAVEERIRWWAAGLRQIAPKVL